MKKSTLLSLATTAAVVATTAGTFAIWDSLSTEVVSNEFTIAADSIKINTSTLTMNGGTEVGGALEYTGDVTFNLKGYDSSRLVNLTLTPTLLDRNNAEVTTGATVEISQTGAENGMAGNVDSKVEETNTYTVKVKITDESLNTKTLKVKLGAQVNTK